MLPEKVIFKNEDRILDPGVLDRPNRLFGLRIEIRVVMVYNLLQERAIEYQSDTGRQYPFSYPCIGCRKRQRTPKHHADKRKDEGQVSVCGT